MKIAYPTQFIFGIFAISFSIFITYQGIVSEHNAGALLVGGMMACCAIIITVQSLD
jgi:hypothetical protein